MPEPRTEAGRRLFTDVEPMDMWESNGVTPEDVIAIEHEATGLDPDSLDAAWAEAEAALPNERWHLQEVYHVSDEGPQWWAMANGYELACVTCGDVPWDNVQGEGDSPAVALRDLAKKLRERAG